MKTLTLSGLALVIVSAVVLAQTANLTGQWKGETKSGTTLELNLTATSTTLTGTMLRRDEVIKLTDGKVQGRTFTFKATINEETAGFTGELDGDQISVWMDRQGRQAAAILKRVKQ
jgi:hypothetical protein